MIITNNDDLVSFRADNLDGLAELTITGNKDLETISFDALQVVPTKVGVTPNVTIGGAGNANALNATSIIQDGVDSADGDFTTSSGLDDLKTYLTAAASNAAAELKVFFDSADDFSDGTTDDTNLRISEADDVAKLTVINRDSSGDAVKAKRAFLVTTIASSTLNVNGSAISWNQTSGLTAADYVSNLMSPANVEQLKNNGVTLTANANGSATATVTTASAEDAALTGVTSATLKADAQKVVLTIGDYSSTVYLTSAMTITDLTPNAIDADHKGAISLLSGASTVSRVLNQIVADFTATASPYILSNASTASASGTLSITAKDKSNAQHGKAVSFTAPSGLGLGALFINEDVAEDDTLIGTNPVIIVESDIAGLTLSTIGSPMTSEDVSGGTTAGDGTTGAGKTELTVTGGTPVELFNNTTDQAASNSVTNLGVDSSTGAANTNNVSWLAG